MPYWATFLRAGLEHWSIYHFILTDADTGRLTACGLTIPGTASFRVASVDELARQLPLVCQACSSGRGSGIVLSGED
jgi:hypothetical protein